MRFILVAVLLLASCQRHGAHCRKAEDVVQAVIRAGQQNDELAIRSLIWAKDLDWELIELQTAGIRLALSGFSVASIDEITPAEFAARGYIFNGRRIGSVGNVVSVYEIKLIHNGSIQSGSTNVELTLPICYYRGRYWLAGISYLK